LKTNFYKVGFGVLLVSYLLLWIWAILSYIVPKTNVLLPDIQLTLLDIILIPVILLLGGSLFISVIIILIALIFN